MGKSDCRCGGGGGGNSNKGGSNKGTHKKTHK